MFLDALEPTFFSPDPPAPYALVMLPFPLIMFTPGIMSDEYCFGDQYIRWGAQTLAPKKHFSSFLFSVVFQQKIS